MTVSHTLTQYKYAPHSHSLQLIHPLITALVIVCFKVWHSKTFNGNDLDKLYHVDIIAELVSIFSPRLVWAEQLDAQGNLHTECRMFGSLALVEKYSTLLNKLRMMKVC